MQVRNMAVTQATDQTLANYCYHRLKEAIIKGHFAPGQKLRIAELKSYLDVGPTPIREALSRLTSSGLVDMEANRGFFVKKVSEAEVRDIYATFNKIELLALNESIELGDISWEADILGSLHKLSVIEKTPSPIDSASWLLLNYQFHYSLIAACDSPCLLKIREGIYQLFDRYCHLSLFTNENALLLNHKDHCEIAQAVIGRDKAKACELTTLHLENSLEQVIERLKPIL
ncbi:putative HTH-type transcriptional regulator BphR [Chlamydiales bacterium STE3]|nr:putative HTH-type transcriptional regulator BphR [Chlamydiales bacterium STE3]